MKCTDRAKRELILTKYKT